MEKLNMSHEKHKLFFGNNEIEIDEENSTQFDETTK